MVERTYIVRGNMPREIFPDLFWLGGCSNSGAWPGRSIHEARHEATAAYIILGSDKTLMVDSGHFGHWYALQDQLDKVLQGRGLDYVLPTHQEIPHAGNLGRLLAAYPQAKAVGDVRDYHLFHPELDLDRLVMMHDGDRIDLGDREFVFLEAIWKDLTPTLWGYDTRLKALFTSDGFGLTHMHEDNICDLMPHEMPESVFDIHEHRYAAPFVGFRYQNQEKKIAKFKALQKQFPIDVIVSAHGGPLMGPGLNDFIAEMFRVFATGAYGPQKVSGTGWKYVSKF